MNTQDVPKTNNIQVIARAADILRLLGRETGGLSLGQIAAEVALPRSTVQRIVQALSAEGFVSTGQRNGGIRLGPELQSLAQASVADRTERLRPIMQRIAAQTGETVDLAVMENGKMLFIDQIVGRQRLRTVSSIGETFPLATTANGKAALACLDQAEAARLVLGELEAAEKADQLVFVLNEIAAIRDGALARDENEHTDGISALGFAFEDASGDICAISIPVPSSRYDRVKDELTKTLSRARNDVKRQ